MSLSTDKITVVAAIINTQHLILYKQDGSTVEIPQGDKRIKPILDWVTPSLVKDQAVSIDLNSPQWGQFDNTYADFEKSSNGLVKFFRVAREKLTTFFGSKPSEQVIGTIPEPETQAEEATYAAAVDDIMAHAQPVITDSDLESKGDTIVAVVNGEVIPDAQQLKPQFAHANRNGDSKGMEKFMSRIAGVISQRRHSVDDLLKFMRRGDLPVGDDGSIIIFKVLRREGDHYVDCHTKKVPQKIGSYVCMDPSLVDPDRRQECSNGLHVARRDYVGSFSGDVCVLAKVDPEDVIAVPEHDPNKMRVCGYHILFELSDADYRKVCQKRSFTDNDAAQIMLGKAISGDHVARLEEVRITQHNGGGVVITPLVPGQKVQKPKSEKEVRKAETISDEGEIQKAEAVDPIDVVRSLPVAEPEEEKPSRNATVQALVNKMNSADPVKSVMAARDLRDVKRRSKKSWNKLGVTEQQVTKMYDLLNQEDTSSRPLVSNAKPVLQKERVRNTFEAKGTPLPAGKDSVLSYKERIALIDPLSSVQAAKSAVLLKRRAKKSWQALGIDPVIGNQIEELSKS